MQKYTSQIDCFAPLTVKDFKVLEDLCHRVMGRPLLYKLTKDSEVVKMVQFYNFYRFLSLKQAPDRFPQNCQTIVLSSGSRETTTHDFYQIYTSMATPTQLKTDKNAWSSAFIIAWKMNTNFSSEVVNGAWYVRRYLMLYSVSSL